MATDLKSLVYVDVCRGAGNLPVTFASKATDVIGPAADISVDAVRLAQQNMALSGSLSSQIVFDTMVKIF